MEVLDNSAVETLRFAIVNQACDDYRMVCRMEVVEPDRVRRCENLQRTEARAHALYKKLRTPEAERIYRDLQRRHIEWGKHPLIRICDWRRKHSLKLDAIRFFNGSWYRELCTIPAFELMQMLDKRAKEEAFEQMQSGVEYALRKKIQRGGQMKHLTRPTRTHKDLMRAVGLDPDRYQIEKDNSWYLYIRNPQDPKNDWEIIDKNAVELVEKTTKLKEKKKR